MTNSVPHQSINTIATIHQNPQNSFKDYKNYNPKNAYKKMIAQGASEMHLLTQFFLYAGEKKMKPFDVETFFPLITTF